MRKGRTALRGGAAALALAALCGAVAEPPTRTTATRVLSSETSAPSPPASGPGDGEGAGGALPVLPAHGGCIIGLNCGCIRGITCPGTIPHRRPAPANAQPHDPPAGPGGGG